MTYSPLAAAIPAAKAAPYPRTGTSTTRAFSPVASSIDPSVLPLSATSTSPLILYCSRNLCALAIQLPKVRASLRQGMRIDSSGVITRDEKGGPYNGSSSRVFSFALILRTTPQEAVSTQGQ